MSSKESSALRIGYVPEHYLLPLHLTTFPFPVTLVPCASGTGQMITMLRNNEVDLAIGLTEGWVAGLLSSSSSSPKDKGYSIVGSWVSTPLRWAIVTGSTRPKINSVADLTSNRRVGVSRMGSGSHIMAFVLAEQEGWLKEQESSSTSSTDLTPVPVGPFADLRAGVNNSPEGEKAKADFFMWEHFTTKPYWTSSSISSKPPLKHVGEIWTPWPSWHIAASTSTFRDVSTDSRLSEVFNALDAGIESFRDDTENAIRMLGTGEAGCHYGEEDAREWIKDVQFAKGTKGVSGEVMGQVVKVLKGAGVVESSMKIQDGDGVVGIGR